MSLANHWGSIDSPGQKSTVGTSACHGSPLVLTPNDPRRGFKKGFQFWFLKNLVESFGPTQINQCRSVSKTLQSNR